MESVKVVHHAHIKRRTGGALFLIAAHVEVRVASSPVGQAVNEPRIAMERKDDWLVRREEGVEVPIWEAVRMLTFWLQLHEIYDIDNADLQFGSMMPQ
jgi:hypothetical protein